MGMILCQNCGATMPIPEPAQWNETLKEALTILGPKPVAHPSQDVAFEQWHNDFYGLPDKYNQIRSLELYDEETGLGYVDTTVNAQCRAFNGGRDIGLVSKDIQLIPIDIAEVDGRDALLSRALVALEQHADYCATYAPGTHPLNDEARLALEIRGLVQP